MGRSPYVLLGPTASGKTAVSLSLAAALDAEIISVDSRQLYRGMEVGSAAPTSEEQARSPHHLVSVADPEDVMTAGEFGRRAQEAAADIVARGKTVLFVGGSGLYLRAALGGLDEELPSDPELRASLRARAESEGLDALHAELAERDPETAAVVSARDAQRITRALEIIELTGRTASAQRTRGRKAEADASIVVLDREREDLEARIRARVSGMLESGLENEVRALVSRDLDSETPALRSVGFAETIRYLNGELDRETWIEEIVVNTRRFAKRQHTWFRGLTGAQWVLIPASEDTETTAGRALSQWGVSI